VIFGDRQFGYRDAGYFYYPLHLRVQTEWEAGRWPLWAPEANGGMPLLGNPAAAVLYPGKLVFAILPYPLAARLYVIGHIVLAFGAMWVLMRGWCVSETASALAALGYAFGAPVLSLTCNVIFLVGAAWAPLGFHAADRWIRLRRPGAVAVLALVLAMQTLGGDPQAAYVTVLCSLGHGVGLAATRSPHQLGRLLRRLATGLLAVYLGLLAFWWWLARARFAASVAAPRREPTLVSPPSGVVVALLWTCVAIFIFWRARGRSRAPGLAPTILGLVGAAAVALALAGAQIVPVLEFVSLSSRAAEFEASYDIYRFGLHPLHVLEALWPNLYGTLDRGNHSWILALPLTRETQLWVPSLYMGALTLLLAAAAAGLRGGPPWRAWLTCVAVVSLLASLGAYTSPLFWARTVPGWSAFLGPLEGPVIPRFRTDGFLRDGDGGVYWFFAAVLPFFGAFRFPGKFLVFTALALSALAGLGWDRLVARRSRRAEVLIVGIVAASLTALGCTWIGAGGCRTWLRGVADSQRSINGPLDVMGALADLRAALAQVTLLLGGLLALAVSAPRRPGPAGLVALAVMTLDLGMANARHVIALPQAVFDAPPHVWKVIEGSERTHPGAGPFRVQRVGSWAPREWLRNASPHRAEEIVRWERQSLRPLHGLPLQASATFALGTAELFDHSVFFHPSLVRIDEVGASALGLRPGAPVFTYPRRGFDLWNTRYFVVPGTLAPESPDRGYASMVARCIPIYPPPGAFSSPDGSARRTNWERSEDVRVLRNEAAFPRAWIVHQARVVAPIRGLRMSDRRDLMQEILFQNDELWHEPARTVYDPRLLAWVETDRPDALAPFLPGPVADLAESVTVTRDDPQRVDLIAVLHKPGLVVVADVYYPGWTLTVDGRPAAILKTNRAMRGAALAAGTHHLVFRYRPRSFRVGITCSALGLICLGGLGIWARRPKARGLPFGDLAARPPEKPISVDPPNCGPGAPGTSA
jgi:hypothetical protein